MMMEEGAGSEAMRIAYKQLKAKPVHHFVVRITNHNHE
jgi:hypothetical protein